MSRPIQILAALAAAVALLATGAAAAQAAYTPPAKTLYRDAPSGRYLLGGDWLFRLDAKDRGVKDRYYRSASSKAWSKVTVPNAWNVGDPSPASMAGGIGWYRKDFSLPNASAALAWAVRFETVNYRARVWLNGHEVGTNTGAYVPFTFRLNQVKRHGTNRLVVRVDSRRLPTDFPPSGLSTDGVPTGGWFNWSGILREVYLDRLDTVAFDGTPQVRPDLPDPAGAARIRLRADLRSVTGHGEPVTVTGDFGGRSVRMGTRTVTGGVTTFTGSLRVARPRLWSPASPTLYVAHVTVRAGGRTVARYTVHSGIRSIKVVGGRLQLNGKDLDFRGVGLHEESLQQGFAIDNARRLQLAQDAKALGATVLRTHYPMHPYMQELADRLGLMIWSEIPVYSVKTQYLALRRVRDLATKELEKNINANGNHPSVMLWSIGNELSSRPGPVQNAYIAAAARRAKQLDPTRPVGLAVAAYPTSLCQASSYAPLDVLGLNDYFGWYPGTNGQIADRTKLSAYLDAARACYPRQALVVTEFGAEADRDGPVEEKGTFGFQQEWTDYHLGVFATKPWLSGAIYWALADFWVRPGWEGGNPRPHPPLHEKGLETQDRVHKPVWNDVAGWYKRTVQVQP